MDILVKVKADSASDNIHLLEAIFPIFPKALRRTVFVNVLKALLSKSCDAICMNMRVLIVLMILAINFSGFSTAAHAFTDAFCDSASGQQVEVGTKCPDHQLTSASEKSTAGDLASQAQCLDCVHCCGGHVYNMPLALLPVQVVVIPVTYPVLTDNIAGEYAFSLLRPPKFSA